MNDEDQNAPEGASAPPTRARSPRWLPIPGASKSGALSPLDRAHILASERRGEVEIRYRLNGGIPWPIGYRTITTRARPRGDSR